VYPEVLFNFGVLRRDHLLGRWLAHATRVLYRDALFVSTPSNSFVATIRNQVAAPQRVQLIRNGFDERMFAPAPNLRKEGPFVCVFHGLLGRMHNIELLLNVADRVGSVRPDVRFVVAGYGPKEKLLRAHSRPNVQFLGAQPYSRIPALLAEADLGLAFIEDTEGTDGAFPVKVYEYIGAGLPVLVTPLSEAGRLIEERSLGRSFSNEDEVGIARTILDSADRGAMYSHWREVARAERHEFSRRRWSDEFAARMQSASVDESSFALTAQ
jgi:glycosyltransferase involved in cell wall biosynthesis